MAKRLDARTLDLRTTVDVETLWYRSRVRPSPYSHRFVSFFDFGDSKLFYGSVGTGMEGLKLATAAGSATLPSC